MYLVKFFTLKQNQAFTNIPNFLVFRLQVIEIKQKISVNRSKLMKIKNLNFIRNLDKLQQRIHKAKPTTVYFSQYVFY